MRFRTEIEIKPSAHKIDHYAPIILLGSCFTDEVGARLAVDGFEVLHNPFGTLYNPLSLSNCLNRVIDSQHYTPIDLVAGPRGFHCLDYATRYSGECAEVILSGLNNTQQQLAESMSVAKTVILTLGSAFVFEYADTNRVVGNCHKLPANMFKRRLLSTSEIFTALAATLQRLRTTSIEQIIFTVSPIRHLADGLHGNTISKSTLHLAIHEICEAFNGFAQYFPAYEILIDDLRDYRFYAADMKHPSPVAIDYVYSVFSATYFTTDTIAKAAEAHKAFLAANHRHIL